MTKKNIITASLAILVCFLLIFFIQREINNIRTEKRLITYSISEQLPPGFAFINAGLGAFKGIILDILWLKAIALQEQGKYFEVGRLAFWITQLNPHLTGATTFLAWNMAYNISVMYSAPKDKWKWIQESIKVLQDAISYNPDSPDLCKELSWIYFNKVSDIFDSGHLYFKTQIATEMDAIYAGRTPTEFFEVIKIADTSSHEYSDLKISLWNKFRLKPEIMVKIENMFGIMDWRISQSLAVYWAYIAHTISPDSREYHKVLMMSLLAYAYRGKLIYFNIDRPDDYISIPDYTMILKANTILAESITAENKFNSQGIFYTFLYKAARETALYGNLSLSEYLFSEMKTYFNDPSPDFKAFLHDLLNEYLMPLPQNEFSATLTNYLKAAYYLKKNAADQSAANNIINTWELYLNLYKQRHKNSSLREFQYYVEKVELNYLQNR